ncbi:hypothetical protein B2G74_01275 [Burkholderia sp. A27]|nr:hypothetical protein B2G74_01275 [Burkholderia sp. A27]
MDAKAAHTAFRRIAHGTLSSQRRITLKTPFPPRAPAPIRIANALIAEQFFHGGGHHHTARHN